VEDVKVDLFQALEVSLCRDLLSVLTPLSILPRLQTANLWYVTPTAARNTGVANFGSTLPPFPLSSRLAVINSSIPLVPISYRPSLTPRASAPLRSTSSSTMLCLVDISCGMLICRLDETSTGRFLSSETVVSRVERWDNVWVR